jgi:putative flippase GtrA
LFLLTGGLAAALNWGSGFLFALWFSLELAVVMAFMVGLITAFTLMRLFVFKTSDKPFAVQAAWFVTINLLALAQTWLVTVGLAHYAFPALGFSWHAQALAHLLGILTPVASSYLGHRHLTFK